MVSECKAGHGRCSSEGRSMVVAGRGAGWAGRQGQVQAARLVLH